MESSVNFNFRNRHHTVSYTVCDREYPTYIYITLKDEVLVKEYGEELVLHSNGGKLLVNDIYSEHRLDLSMAIFMAISAVENLKENLVNQ